MVVRTGTALGLPHSTEDPARRSRAFSSMPFSARPVLKTDPAKKERECR